MKTLKKVQRFVLLALLIMLAASGVMFTGFLPTPREKYMDKEIRIEQVDKKEDEADTDDDSTQAKS